MPSFTHEDFEDALLDILHAARDEGMKSYRVISLDLNKAVVSDRERNHRMPMACKAMWKLWRRQGSDEDRIIDQKSKDNIDRESSNVEIEYSLASLPDKL